MTTGGNFNPYQRRRNGEKFGSEWTENELIDAHNIIQYLTFHAGDMDSAAGIFERGRVRTALFAALACIGDELYRRNER